MNTSKAGNYGKMVAFFLIAAILLCAFGFTAEGWQINNDEKPESGDSDKNSGQADENKDGSDAPTEPEEPEEPSIYIPEHVNSLTGTETTEELAGRRPVCFVMSSLSPIYGTSGADIIAELPTENGETRLLAFTSVASELGKIGSIAPTRRYMSNIARYFGAILISNGNDDTIEYDGLDVVGSSFDLTERSGYHYTEYTHFNYTNGALISAGIANAGIGTAINPRVCLPFSFTEFGADPVSGEISASSISLPYPSSKTEFRYDASSEDYVFMKDGVAKNDMLTDEALHFTNVFILFADTVTYESAEASEMVMDTVEGGKGYYITRGKATLISWQTNADGSIIFNNESGERITSNRGRSYIGFVKSALSDDVVLK